MSGERSGRREGGEVAGRAVPGIVIAVGKPAEPDVPPRPHIQAFVWGARARPTPTLPYGRWKSRA